jgi:RHS repeat-associated protein
MSVTEQRYKAVLAVIGDGRTVSEVATDWGVSRRTMHRWLVRYGGLASSTGSITNPFRFAGQYQDPSATESGFYYLRARYYDPATGGFISLDRIVSTTRQPYAYSTDSPLDNADPSGLTTFGWCLGAAAAWGIGGFVQGCLQVATKSNTPVEIAKDVGAGLLCSTGPTNPLFSFGCNYLASRVTQVGATFTVGGGGGSPSAGVYGGIQVSNGTKISDLNGLFAYAGGGAGAGVTGQGTGFIGQNGCHQTIVGGDVDGGVGVRLPIAFEYHAGASNTWSWSDDV